MLIDQLVICLHKSEILPGTWQSWMYWKHPHSSYMTDFLAASTPFRIPSSMAVINIGGHRHRSQCRRYPTSDMDIFYSDIGDKYVGLKNVIPISEVFRYRHQSSFRYRTLKKKNISLRRFKPMPLELVSRRYNTKLLWLSVYNRMSDIGYGKKLYSDIRYNVGLRSLSPISEVPISGSVRYHWSRIYISD